MIAKCPSCGKRFEMIYPQQWAYNINKKEFFCSWKCLQQHRRKKEAIKLGKITLEQKKQAVNIAVAGGDPLSFLKECGSDKPAVSWSNILRFLEKQNPETYDLITSRKKANVDKWMPKKDDVPVVKVDEPIVIETPETNQVRISETPEGLDKMTRPITKPVNYDGFSVRAVSGVFGRYSYSETRSAYIDYENNDGDELSMTLEQWRGFLDELRRAALVLGVEL